jgi:NADPH:quinone reductase-like Zn-dependent oxidoreductase
MRVVELHEFGAVENLKDAERPGPACGPDDIRIAVRAVSFNPIDYKLREKSYGAARLPVVLGFDVAGIVTEVGHNIVDLADGDEVMAYLGGPSMAGGYASEVVVPRAMVSLKPRNIDFAEAAAIPLTALTALRCLKRAGTRPTQSLLVTGAAGGAGSWVVLLARALGIARISAIAGRVESSAYLRQECGLPADRVIDYRDLSRTDLAARAIAANDGTFYDVAIDCAGGEMTHLCCDSIGLDGHVVSIVNGADPSVEETLFDRSATFHSELVYAAAESGDPARYSIYARQLDEIAALIERGPLRLPRIADLGSLSAATVAKAHRLLAGGKTIGKLVARVD